MNKNGELCNWKFALHIAAYFLVFCFWQLGVDWRNSDTKKIYIFIFLEKAVTCKFYLENLKKTTFGKIGRMLDILRQMLRQLICAVHSFGSGEDQSIDLVSTIMKI
jgi:hypothetical protein